MKRATSLRVERVVRRRGSFGLDERRRPDPLRIEAEIRAFLQERLPEVWSMPSSPEPAGRTVVLLLSRGHVAVLRIEPDSAAPDVAASRLIERCRAQAIPAAVVSSLAEARAALRRFGIEPRPSPAPVPLLRMFARCREKSNP